MEIDSLFGEFLIHSVNSNSQSDSRPRARQFHAFALTDAPRNTGKSPQIGGCYSGVQSSGLGLSAGDSPAEGDVSHSRKPKVTDARLDDLAGCIVSCFYDKL
jgi:hypothetical protein